MEADPWGWPSWGVRACGSDTNVALQIEAALIPASTSGAAGVDPGGSEPGWVGIIGLTSHDKLHLVWRPLILLRVQYAS